MIPQIEYWCLDCFALFIFLILLMETLRHVFMKYYGDGRGKETTNDEFDEKPKVVINQGKAFCQRIKFVMRLKRRMRDFKTRKDTIAKEKFACNKD